jgi:nicotinate-nucleotide adenylyltransferase
MKIAILGGSFDPPHLGHYLIAEQIKEALHMDEVWLMPLFQKALQDKMFHKKLSPVEHRLAMTQLLENEFIKTSDFEIRHNQTSYSIDTLKKLSEQYPQHTFYWILGSDQLSGFQKYYQWQELLKQNLIVFPREHMLWHVEERVREAFQLQTIPENVTVLQNRELILTNISSSIIRERVQKKVSIRFLVPETIETYIKKNTLYV